MMTTTITSVQNNTPLTKVASPKSPVEEGLFPKILNQTLQKSEASLGVDRAAYVSQIFAHALEKPKRTSVIIEENASENLDPSVEWEDAPKKAAAIKNVLTGIVEENGKTAAKKELNGNPFASHLKQEFRKDVLLSQLPGTNTPAAVQQNRQQPNQTAAPRANLTQNAPASTPFQVFLDKAIDFFETVSDYENKSDAMMQDYVEGKMSLEEMTIARTKIGLALSFSVTLINQVTQTFKEIQNMQV
jgi:flagellar hook-basal body complex protein FliE